MSSQFSWFILWLLFQTKLGNLTISHIDRSDIGLIVYMTLQMVLAVQWYCDSNIDMKIKKASHAQVQVYSGKIKTKISEKSRTIK